MKLIVDSCLGWLLVSIDMQCNFESYNYLEEKGEREERSNKI